MADTKVIVTMISGQTLNVLLTGVSSSGVKTAIEAKKAAGEMIDVRGQLIAPEHIETVKVRA